MRVCLVSTCVYCSLLLGAPVRAGFPACVRVCLVSTCVYCSLVLGAPVRAGFPAWVSRLVLFVLHVCQQINLI